MGARARKCAFGGGRQFVRLSHATLTGSPPLSGPPLFKRNGYTRVSGIQDHTVPQGKAAAPLRGTSSPRLGSSSSHHVAHQPTPQMQQACGNTASLASNDGPLSPGKADVVTGTMSSTSSHPYPPEAPPTTCGGPPPRRTAQTRALGTRPGSAPPQASPHSVGPATSATRPQRGATIGRAVSGSWGPASKKSRTATLSAETPRRADAPPVFNYATGSRKDAIEIARDPTLRQEALDEFHEHVYASSTRQPRANRTALWQNILAAAGRPPLDMSVETFETGAAVLKKAKFRTAYAVAAQSLVDHQERGGHVSPALRRAAQKAKRSCGRGLGPVKHTAPFPLERALELPSGADPWVTGGPRFPRALILTGCWWCCREIELANIAIADIKMLPNGEVALHLPATKSDICALGATRSHKCACGIRSGKEGLMAQGLCPACALHSVHCKMVKEGAHDGDPMFPTMEGDYPSKQSVVATIVHAARLLNLPLTNTAGSNRWGGHALRRGGVQYLAKAGVEVWRIQALCRHSSDSIKHYLDDALNEGLADIAQTAAAGRSLHSVRDELRTLAAAVAAGTASVNTLQGALHEGHASPGRPLLPIHTSDVLAYDSPAPPRPTVEPKAGFIVPKRANGKVHVRDLALPSSTLCGWAWEKSGTAAPSQSAGTHTRCVKCWECKAHDQSELSSSDSSSSE